VSNTELAHVGQHFIVGLRPTTALHQQDRQLLRDLRPAGVILYKSNFHHDRPYEEWLSSHANLIAAIREAACRERLFIGIDHEGGRVCRTPPPITRFSYARSWGDNAGSVGGAIGTELASLGVNLNFAPVLDIDSNPNNPVIGARSFGDTPEVVTEKALSFLTQMEANGVRACGKHFPGHGDTKVDSHCELPIIDAPLDVLRNRELKPFAAAIKSGIGMIMTSHILFRALDDVRPATLSRPIAHDLLRREMAFEGITVSDDIGMHAVSTLFDNPDATVQFMAAGNDMLMICAHWTDTERVRGLARAIFDARRAGIIDGRILDRSHARIDAMLATTAQNEVRALSGDVFRHHALPATLFSDDTVEVV
jgi:beta-N-acetylhexosaminidase